jgi:hypothetical protein
VGLGGHGTKKGRKLNPPPAQPGATPTTTGGFRTGRFDAPQDPRLVPPPGGRRPGNPPISAESPAPPRAGESPLQALLEQLLEAEPGQLRRRGPPRAGDSSAQLVLGGPAALQLPPRLPGRPGAAEDCVAGLPRKRPRAVESIRLGGQGLPNPLAPIDAPRSRRGGPFAPYDGSFLSKQSRANGPSGDSNAAGSPQWKLEHFPSHGVSTQLDGIITRIAGGKRKGCGNSAGAEGGSRTSPPWGMGVWRNTIPSRA